MGIEAPSSSINVSTVSQSGAKSSNVSNKAASDSSFKDEMAKVSESKKEEQKSAEKTDKPDQNTHNTDVNNDEKSPVDKNDMVVNENTQNFDPKFGLEQQLNGALSFNQFALNNANNLLSNDIEQMKNFSCVNKSNYTWNLELGSAKNNLKISETDAQFFIELAKNDDVNINTITAQAQNMLNSGAELSEVKQNFRVSQALLSALTESREKNQPLRIEFDQNVSLILRVGKDGALAAHFIPGDKAVEQYLKSNIETLKQTLKDQDLPYTELSYSNSSKQQNERRRNQQQQGE